MGRAGRRLIDRPFEVGPSDPDAAEWRCAHSVVASQYTDGTLPCQREQRDRCIERQ